MPKLTYPISLKYSEDWGTWEIVRELVQNAWDASEDWTLDLDGGSLIVSDVGGGMAARNLILGVTDKDDSHRGKYGEGLKLAMIVATRLGMEVEVLSHNLWLKSGKGNLFDEEVLEIEYEEVEDTYPGTKVIVEPWTDEIYKDRFLRAGDPRIVHTDDWGRCILSQDLPDIFVKNIWVHKATNGVSYGFGYNLTQSKLNRDRNVISSWDMAWEIGQIWSTVSDESLLKSFFVAVKDGMAEAQVNMRYSPTKHKDAMRRAFQGVYGTNAVIETNAGDKREAEYLGAKAVRVGEGLESILEEVVGSDRKYVTDMQGKSQVYVKDSALPSDHLTVLKGLRRLAKRVNVNLDVRAYVFEDSDTKANFSKQTIRISHTILGDRERALAALIHELAHSEYGTADATAGMVQAVGLQAASMLAPYVWRG